MFTTTTTTATAGPNHSPLHRRWRHHTPSPLSLAPLDLALKNLQSREDYLDNDSPLNLGAETPTSVGSIVQSPTTSVFADSDPSYFTLFRPAKPPSVKRSISSSSLSSLGKQCFLRGPSVSRDCGICFERAVKPNRMRCCGAVFCLEHITEWLFGAHSNNRCPACKIHLSSPDSSSMPTPQIRTPASNSPTHTDRKLALPQHQSRSDTADQHYLITRHGAREMNIKGLVIDKLRHLDKDSSTLRSFFHAASHDLLSFLIVIVCLTLIVSVFFLEKPAAD